MDSIAGVVNTFVYLVWHLFSAFLEFIAFILQLLLALVGSLLGVFHG